MTTPNAHALDLADMIAHPEKYGFKWGFGSVSRKDKSNGQKYVVCEQAPFIIHTPEGVQKMLDTFGPTYFVDMANGTSGKVRDQDATRGPCAEDLKLRNDADALKRLVLLRALDQRAPRTHSVTVVEKLVEVEVTRYAAADGLLYDTQAEAMAATIDWAQNR